MTGSVSGCWSVWAKERLARHRKAIKKTYFFIGKRFCWAKVGNSPEKLIMNDKFDYFCSVNWDNCMDGKSQIQQGLVDAIFAEHSQKAITLDNVFEGNDQLKTNTAFQMRDAGVDFRTV